jgi:imidazoleglycerol-phosphate dehydratase
MMRKAEVIRKTKETDIKVLLDLDGTGKYSIETGIPFLNHMLELFSKHSFIDLELLATGDLQVDGHHTVEDTGIVLGEALNKALGDKTNIARYGFSILPMDESLVMAAIDLSGRSYFASELNLPKEEIGGLSTVLIDEFFQAFVDKAQCNLHLRLLAGKNTHHMIEATFKGFAKALMMAVSPEPRSGIPSTKGKI